MRKKVVAHIVQDLKIGGLERIVETVSTGMDREVYSPAVLCLSEGGVIAEEIVSKGITVDILNITDYHSFASLLSVVQWLKMKHADIVHTHGYPAGILGRKASILARVPALFHHFHTYHLNAKRRHHFAEKIFSLFTDKIICCSEAVKTYTRQMTGISEQKLAVIYNGIREPEPSEEDNLLHLKKNLGIPANALVAGCVASLRPHKGHEYLIDAVREIDDLTLLLVGDGSSRKQLERQADELGMGDRVLFAGNQTAVTPYLRIMDIVVLASPEREGLAISLIEAMALAKPVVATRVGGIPEVVENDKSGLLVPGKDKESLARSLKQLLGDAGMRMQMGMQGRRIYEKKFSSQMMLDQLDCIYRGECRPSDRHSEYKKQRVNT